MSIYIYFVSGKELKGFRFVSLESKVIRGRQVEFPDVCGKCSC